MKAVELYAMIKNGMKPIVKFKDSIYEILEDSIEPQMIGKIIGAYLDEDDGFWFIVDLNEYEAHNRKVASHDWKDENGNSTLTWFETIFYPQDGKEKIFLFEDYDTSKVMEFVSGNELLYEYIDSKSNKSYVEWLEQMILKLR